MKKRFLVIFLFSLVSISYAGHITASPPILINVVSPQEGVFVNQTVLIEAQLTTVPRVKSVKFYVDETLIGEDTTSPYQYEWDTTAYSDGQHQIHASIFQGPTPPQPPQRPNSFILDSPKIYVTVDNTPPEGTLTINNDALYTNSTEVILNLSAVDNLSGMDKMQFSNDGSSWSPPEDYTTSKIWTLTDGDGTKAVYVKFKDVVGNWSEAISDNIILDTTPPVVDIISPADGLMFSTTPITVSGIVNDNIDNNPAVTVNGKMAEVISGGFSVADIDLTLGNNAITAIATDLAGNSNSDSVIIIYDNTKPTTPIVTDDGDYTVSLTELYATWSSSDSQSSISEYKYSIGTSTGATDIVDWTSVGTNTEVNHTGLSLTQGKTYYFNVKAVNGVGIESDEGYSDGITVNANDNIPIAPLVVDDGRYTTSTNQLHAYWIPQTLETDIIEYKYSIGTTQGNIDVVSWTSVGTETEVTHTGIYLEHGQTYYFNVKAKNINGTWSAIGSSNGIIVDANLPVIYGITPKNDSTFFTGTKVDIDVYAQDDDGDPLEYQFLVDDEVGKDWSSSSTFEWTAVPTTTIIRKITCRVRDDKGGTTSEDVYYNVQINISDSTPPTTPMVTTNEYSDSLNRLYASWSSQDYDSGIVQFEYAIGTTPGGTDVVDWTSAGTNTTIIHYGLSLTAGQNYYVSVTATNGTGLISSIGNSSLINATEEVSIKITAPQDGALITENEVTITGIAEGVSEVEINGKTVNVNPDGTFSGPILIAPGTAARKQAKGEDLSNYIIMNFPDSTIIKAEAKGKTKKITVYCYQVFVKSDNYSYDGGGNNMMHGQSWNNSTLIQCPFSEWPEEIEYTVRYRNESGGSPYEWIYGNFYKGFCDYRYHLPSSISSYTRTSQMTFHTLPAINSKIQPMVLVFKNCDFYSWAIKYYNEYYNPNPILTFDLSKYKVNGESLKMLYGEWDSYDYLNYEPNACYVILDNYTPDTDTAIEVEIPTYEFTLGGEPYIYSFKHVSLPEIDVLNVDLDIDGVSEEYEEDAPGKIISLTREGDEKGLDDLAEITINMTPPADISPSVPSEASLTLQALRGGSRIKVWEDEAKTIQVELGKTNYIDKVPKTLYVDGVEKGEAVLELVYKDEEGNQVASDKVAILVTETISWSPAKGKTAYTWEPCYEQFNNADYTKAFIDEVEKQGWKVTRYIDHSYDGDVEKCTLENYKKMCDAGMLYVITHGGITQSSGAFSRNRDVIDAWISTEPDFTTIKDGEKYYYANIPSSWLANNWAPTLNENKAIVNWYSCHSAERYPDFEAVMDAAGGRWRIGYEGEPYLTDCDGVNKKFFRRMNGTDDNGQKRTAGEAWDNGAGYIFKDWEGKYIFRVRMHGNDWTTLCPAPIMDNGTYVVYPYPCSQPGNKGYGCVIFDTYMNDIIPATDALKSNGGPTSNHRWDGRAEGKFILGFDYDNTGGGWTEMWAVGNQCRSKDEDPEIGRAMDANRVAPNSDKKPETIRWNY